MRSEHVVFPNNSAEADLGWGSQKSCYLNFFFRILTSTFFLMIKYFPSLSILENFSPKVLKIVPYNFLGSHFFSVCLFFLMLGGSFQMLSTPWLWIYIKEMKALTRKWVGVHFTEGWLGKVLIALVKNSQMSRVFFLWEKWTSTTSYLQSICQLGEFWKWGRENNTAGRESHYLVQRF